MTVSVRQGSADETVRRAEDLYERNLRSRVEGEHLGRYIAIDVESGEYEVANDYHRAAQTLIDRCPAATVAVLRIGYPTVGRIGGRVRAELP